MTTTAEKPRGRGRFRLAVKLLLSLFMIAAVGVAIAAVKGWPSVRSESSSADASSEPASGDPSDLWCREHGVPERLCTLCHPELVEKLLWCGEHSLPEDLCTLCHPELAEQFTTCTAHGLPKAFCVACGTAGGTTAPDPDAMPPVRLAAPAIAEDAGIEVRPVQSAEHVPTVEGNARVGYNENRFTHVRPRVDGIVHEVRVDLGSAVRRGDVLAVVDSAALGKAKADYLAALALIELADKEVVRIRDLVAKEIAPQKELFQGEHQLEEAQIGAALARQTLLNLGLSKTDVDRVRRTQDTGSLLNIPAALDGVVVERHAVVGEPVQATSDLFAVGDLSTMWVHLDLYEKDLHEVRVGQRAGFVAPSLSADVFPGVVTWISSEIDRRTRTVPVRIEVKNVGGVLRANQFGKGYIEITAPHSVLTVPKQAVQSYESQYVVFVKKSDILYEPRRVQMGHQFGSDWEITSGVAAGEQVVTTGSFLFKTELDRGAIGAGCCAPRNGESAR